MFYLANIRSEEGWSAFIRGLHSAFSTDVGELLAIGAVVGVVALYVVNVKIARIIERRSQR